MSTPMEQPLDRFRTTRRVEFSDTDMGGIVHFSRFFVYMETAEHDFLRALGINVHFKHEGRTLGWPKRSVECEFFAPARLGEELEIEVRVLRKGTTSLTNEFLIRRGETLLARGRLSLGVLRSGRSGRGAGGADPGVPGGSHSGSAGLSG